MSRLNPKLSKKALLNYIDKEQIAFQFSDGLLTFTKPGKKFDESDFYLGIADEINEMKSVIKNSVSLKTVSKEDFYDDNLGFAEFAKWSVNQDLLILVNENLLLCLPNNENYEEIFE